MKFICVAHRRMRSFQFDTWEELLRHLKRYPHGPEVTALVKELFL